MEKQFGYNLPLLPLGSFFFAQILLLQQHSSIALCYRWVGFSSYEWDYMTYSTQSHYSSFHCSSTVSQKEVLLAWVHSKTGSGVLSTNKCQTLRTRGLRAELVCRAGVVFFHCHKWKDSFVSNRTLHQNYQHWTYCTHTHTLYLGQLSCWDICSNTIRLICVFSLPEVCRDVMRVASSSSASSCLLASTGVDQLCTDSAAWHLCTRRELITLFITAFYEQQSSLVATSKFLYVLRRWGWSA